MADLRMMSIDDPGAPDKAARVIVDGGVIAFPTDTVYGVGVNLWRPEAIARLYAAKGRPEEKALPVLMGHMDQWAQVACNLPATARHLMSVFWPGALTVVVPRRPDVPDAVGALTQTIALRVPAHAALRRILMRTGPLATSSANRSGEPPTAEAGVVRATLGDGVTLLLDGGTLPPSAPSTVVDATGHAVVILRHGAISDDDIERALAPLGGKPSSTEGGRETQ